VRLRQWLPPLREKGGDCVINVSYCVQIEGVGGVSVPYVCVPPTLWCEVDCQIAHVCRFCVIYIQGAQV